MIPIAWNKRLLGVQLMLLVLLAVAVTVVHLTPLRELRMQLRSQHVTSGMLDYGEKGKILKSLGLVYGVRGDGPTYAPYAPDSRGNLFQKKRKKGEYIYRANPGSEFQLPSTLVIEPSAFRDGWSLVSLALDETALDHPLRGIAANPLPRGRAWERRATFSLFRRDELVTAASIGVRIHGSNLERVLARGELDQNYRLYLRYYYGADSVPAEQVFGHGDASVKRLVLRKSRLFVTDLAQDVARRAGALVPHHVPIILYLNGSNLGVYALQEHVGRRQWALRLGHDDLYFVRHSGTTDVASANAYRELSRWLATNSRRQSMERVSQRIDLRNLTRDLFTLMFCGSNDRFEETAVLDLSETQPRWRWITWELSDCFGEGWRGQDGSESRRRAALRQVVARDPASGDWSPTYRSLRSDLFAALLNDSPAYVDYFLRTVTDVLNHELTPEFLERRYVHYEELLAAFGDPIADARIAEFRSAGAFMRNRPAFVREDVRRTFGPVGIHTVEVAPLRGEPFTVDGYPKHGAYTGRYYTGQSVEVYLPRAVEPASVVWRLNGDTVSGNPVIVPVSRDMVIEIERIDGDV